MPSLAIAIQHDAIEGAVGDLEQTELGLDCSHNGIHVVSIDAKMHGVSVDAFDTQVPHHSHSCPLLAGGIGGSRKWT